MPSLNGTHSLLYADDLSVFVIEDSLIAAVDKLQNSVSSCSQWLKDKALKLNPAKSQLMLFTRKKVSNFPGLYLDGVRVNLVTKCKFLGLFLDAPLLTWSYHINYVKAACSKRLKIMKALTSTSWGANRRLLTTFYFAFIKSKMSYGIEIYSSACPSKLNALEVLQNTALRIITGLPKATLICSLQFESEIPSIFQSIDHHILKYFYKIQLYPYNHILHELLVSQTNYVNTLSWVTLPHKSPFILRAGRVCRKFGLQSDILKNIEPYFPYPWLSLGKFISPEFLIEHSKRDVSSAVVSGMFHDMTQRNYHDFCKCFTDGSKSTEAVGAAMYVEDVNMTMSWRINADHSVLMAELFAIYNCLLWIFDQTYFEKFVIYSDSLTAIKMVGAYALKSYKVMVSKIQKLLLNIDSKNIAVVLQWIPSHSGIVGNEVVDAVAKTACHYSDITVLDLEFDEYLSLIRRRLRDAGLAYWNRVKSDIHFGTIVDDISKWKWLTSGNRHCDVLMAKMRSGVLNVNSFLFRLNIVDSPNCIYCIGAVESIHHYLLECPRHVLARHKLFSKLGEIGLTQNNISIPILLSGTDFSPNKWRKIMHALYVYFSDTGKLKSL